MKTLIRSLVASASVLILSACMSPVKTGPDCSYVINSVPDRMMVSRKRGLTILVSQPITDPVYNTTRMAFTTHPYQIGYYSRSHWVDSPSGMLSPLLIQTLQKTNRFKAVVSPPFPGAYDYVLDTKIKTLLIDYTCGTPVVKLTLQEDIIGASSGRLIASRVFSTSEPIPQKSPYAAVYAANHATERLLAKIAVWVVRHT